jgi:DNA invertase Pin-like site-specific DNA recombinase
VEPSATSPDPLAFSYVRFSTPEQAQGDSLRRQAEAARGWCLRRNVRLDEATTFRDLGRSAYTGQHRQNPDRNALAAFLRMVENGRVPRGSYLVIENLDRLSREDIRPALTLLLNLIESGVRVVQLRPVEQVFDENVEPMQLMMAIMELSRGNSESRIKSERLARAWDAKRAAVRERKVTGKCPFWLSLSEDRTTFTVKADAARVVRRIFRLARHGRGAATVARELNTDNVPSPYGRPWNNVSVLWVLRNRAVLGEYTPHRGRGKGRKPAGEPVAGYFPVVIEPKEFDAVSEAIAQRKLQRGPRGKYVRNLFTGILFDATDGTPVHLNEKRPGNVTMVGSGAMRGKGARYVSFPYAVFERAVLSRLREVDPAEVLGADDGPNETLSLAGELAGLDTKIAELEAELLAGDVAALARVLRQLEVRKRELAAALAEARRKAANPLAEGWGECQGLLAALDAAPDPTDARLRLRAALGRCVESVHTLFATRTVAGLPVRVAAMRVQFAGVDDHRDYLVVHARGKKPGVKSFKGPGDAPLDLRRPRDAEKLLRWLETNPPAPRPSCEGRAPSLEVGPAPRDEVGIAGTVLAAILAEANPGD